MLKRLIYLGYYFKELDRDRLRTFLNHVSREEGIPKLKLWMGMIGSSLRYNISLLEYFQFHFYRLSAAEKQTYAGTGYMYEYQLAMNPRAHRRTLSDKLVFLREYASFVKHPHASLVDMRKDPSLARRLLANPSGKVVLKSSDGQCGIGIEVKESSSLTPESLVRRLEETGNDYVEAFVVQHKELMRLSPSGLNTVRIITQLDSKNRVDILGARLRISVNSAVDNLAAGNIAAPINIQTGVVEGAGVYSDITRNEVDIHPVTGVPIIGFSIPYWEETIRMINEAAVVNTKNRSIGWDVAITDDGPELIEGNHDWCKLLWQLPVKIGLRHVLESY